jgi:hypothetical protein
MINVYLLLDYAVFFPIQGKGLYCEFINNEKIGGKILWLICQKKAIRNW